MENEFKTVIKEFIDGKGTFHSIVQISDNIFHDKETGYLYCKNSILGGIGIQKYYGKEIGLKDGKEEKEIEMVRESVDVFDSESMATFNGKPVTLFHPEGKVNSKNYKKFIVGSLNDAKQDENNKDNLIGDVVIYDEYTVDKVMKGELKDLSLGYRAKVIPMADGRYKQTDIVINHLAIVEEGRAKMAQIVDSKPVEEEIEALEPQDFTDKIHVTERVEIIESTDTYDDETSESTYQKNVKTVEKHSHYEKMKQILMDNKTNKKGETKMEKDFKYFMAELKDLATYPKGEFRDQAYEALKVDCKDTLGTVLPTIEDTKQSVIANSVGLKDSNSQFQEEEQETEALEIYAKDESRFYEKLYRKMDNTETARKYAGMTFHDVYTAIQEGKVL